MANDNIEDPALADINSNAVFNSKAPAPPLLETESRAPAPPLLTESKAPPLVTEVKALAPPLLAEGSLVDDNVVNLPPPVQSLEKPNEGILSLGRGEVELMDEVEEQPDLRTETEEQESMGMVIDAKKVEKQPDLRTETENQGSIGMVSDAKKVEKLPNLRTEKVKQGPIGMVTGVKTVEKKPEAVHQGSAEIVSDVKPVEDRGVNTFETEEAVKEETEVTLMKDVKAADLDLEDFKTETAQQESKPNDVVNVEDDWGDFEEAFGDDQEVAEVEVIGGDENHDDLLHADSDEEVGDGEGLVKSMEMR